MPARGNCALLAVTLFVGAWCAPVAAQPSPRTDAFRDMPSQLLKDLGRKLELTDEQKTQIVVLKKEFEEKNKAKLKQLRREVQRVRQGIQAARKNNNAAALQKAKSEAKSLRQTGERLQEEFEGKLLNLLSDAQRKQYADVKVAAVQGQRAKAAPATSTIGVKPVDRR
jgi:Spy/CpxP family protein refolding chaperone